MKNKKGSRGNKKGREREQKGEEGKRGEREICALRDEVQQEDPLG